MRVASVLLAGLLVPACSGINNLPGQTCESNHELIVDVPPDAGSATLQYRLRTCQADIDACPGLCQAVLANARPDGTGSEQACLVTFQGDIAHVRVAYQLADGPNCPVFNAGAGGAPAPQGGGGL